MRKIIEKKRKEKKRKEKKRKESSFLLFAFTFGCCGSQDGGDGKDNGEKKNKQKQINTPHIHLPYEDKY